MFDLQHATETLHQQAQGYFDQQMLEHVVIEDNLLYFDQMIQATVGWMQMEGNLHLDGKPTQLPYDQATAEKVLGLVSMGVARALDKCVELKVEGRPKGWTLEQTTKAVFDMAKQTAVSTYGQEHTPEMQIPEAQQQEWMHQTAENGMHYFLGEYEKLYGPIHAEKVDSGFEEIIEVTETLPGAPLPSMPIPETQPEAIFDEPFHEEARHDEALEDALPGLVDNDDWLDDFDEEEFDNSGLEEDDTTWLDDLKNGGLDPDRFSPDELLPAKSSYDPVAPIPSPTPAKPAPSPALYKYAAVALFVNAVEPALAERILANFSAYERQSIDIYRHDPDRIARELDLNLVDAKLQQFKLMLEQNPAFGQGTPLTKAQRQIKYLAHAYPKEAVLSCVERERPEVIRYIQGYLQDTDQNPLEEKPQLPGKIEEILYYHLNKTLSYR